MKNTYFKTKFESKNTGLLTTDLEDGAVLPYTPVDYWDFGLSAESLKGVNGNVLSVYEGTDITYLAESVSLFGRTGNYLATNIPDNISHTIVSKHKKTDERNKIYVGNYKKSNSTSSYGIIGTASGVRLWIFPKTGGSKVTLDPTSTGVTPNLGEWFTCAVSIDLNTSTIVFALKTDNGVYQRSITLAEYSGNNPDKIAVGSAYYSDGTTGTVETDCFSYYDKALSLEQAVIAVEKMHNN